MYDIKASGTMTRDNATEKKPQNAECKEKFPGLHFKCGMPAMFVASERRGPLKRSEYVYNGKDYLLHALTVTFPIPEPLSN